MQHEDSPSAESRFSFCRMKILLLQNQDLLIIFKNTISYLSRIHLLSIGRSRRFFHQQTRSWMFGTCTFWEKCVLVCFCNKTIIFYKLLATLGAPPLPPHPHKKKRRKKGTHTRSWKFGNINIFILSPYSTLV